MIEQDSDSASEARNAEYYNFNHAVIDCTAFIETLSSPQREIVEDYIVRQFTVSEIARLRGLKYSKVLYILRKALLPLARDYGIPPPGT